MSKIGEILKNEREAKKLSIKQVCEETKIRDRVLVAIESEDYSVMPEVYLRSFIKVYAEYLNVKLEKYANESGEPEKNGRRDSSAIKKNKIFEDLTFNFKPNVELDHNTFSQKRFKHFNKQYLVNILIYTALSLALITLLILAFYPQDTQQNETKNQKKDTMNIKQEPSGLLSSFSQSDAGDSIRLEAISSDSSWLYIDIDGVSRKEALLVPKDKKEWRANEFFVLTVGNAGAVKFYRNGQELPSFGGYGKVARGIRITRNDIITPQKQLDRKDTARKQSGLLKPATDDIVYSNYAFTLPF